jgi:murein L,D-transpeptidase YcbB/YkuD
MKKFISGSLLILCTISVILCSSSLAAPDKTIAGIIENLLSSGVGSDPLYGDFKRFATVEELGDVYQKNSFEPLWIKNGKPGGTAEIIKEYLEKSYLDGLQPEKYGIAKINGLWPKPDSVSLAHLDLLITIAIISYIHDTSFGRIQPRLKNPELFSEAGRGTFSLYQILQELTTHADPAEYLEGLTPQHHYYARLKHGLSEYRLLKKAGGWPIIQAGRTLRPGDSDERIPFLRKRLFIEGDYSGGDRDNGEQVYDAALVDAVKAYQQRHGLLDDAIIGKATYQQLQASVDDVIEKITINLARWRWMDHDLGSNYVLVNIANFDLVGVKENKTVLQLAVVVGADRHQTPVFSALIQHVELNPFWTIPTSIAVKEELPALRKDPSHLKKRNVRMFSGWDANAQEIDSTKMDWHQVSGRQMQRYVLRQDPGPGNALGYIKVVFPNKYSVYLHDTPQRHLFTQSKRNFSHGCIRVSTPERLAIFLLEGSQPEWDEERIREVISIGKNRVLPLPVKIPVHLTYQTTWADQSGRIHFNVDIYGRDNVLLEALAY